MNSQLNVHYTPNFQANYVVKGCANDVRKLNTLLKRSLGRGVAFSHDLIPEYTQDQQYVEKLYSTAEDMVDLICYSMKEATGVLDPGKIVRKRPHRPRKLDTHELMHEVTEVVEKEDPTTKEYVKAAKAGGDAFAYFMLDLYQNARVKLVEILGKDKVKDVRFVDAKEGLKAIEEKKFDFINGIIRD